MKPTRTRKPYETRFAILVKKRNPTHMRIPRNLKPNYGLSFQGRYWQAVLFDGLKRTSFQLPCPAECDVEVARAARDEFFARLKALGAGDSFEQGKPPKLMDRFVARQRIVKPRMKWDGTASEKGKIRLGKVKVSSTQGRVKALKDFYVTLEAVVLALDEKDEDLLTVAMGKAREVLKTHVKFAP